MHHSSCVLFDGIIIPDDTQDILEEYEQEILIPKEIKFEQNCEICKFVSYSSPYTEHVCTSFEKSEHNYETSECTVHTDVDEYTTQLEIGKLELCQSKADTEEYWCRIDPDALVLTDIDYIRAKCKWYFKNITDYETNPRTIEHMKYLDLFTQCFTISLLENKLSGNYDEDIAYYNYQPYNRLSNENFTYPTNWQNSEGEDNKLMQKSSVVSKADCKYSSNHMKKKESLHLSLELSGQQPNIFWDVSSRLEDLSNRSSDINKAGNSFKNSTGKLNTQRCELREQVPFIPVKKQSTNNTCKSISCSNMKLCGDNDGTDVMENLVVPYISKENRKTVLITDFKQLNRVKSDVTKVSRKVKATSESRDLRETEVMCDSSNKSTHSENSVDIKKEDRFACSPNINTMISEWHNSAGDSVINALNTKTISSDGDLKGSDWNEKFTSTLLVELINRKREGDTSQTSCTDSLESSTLKPVALDSLLCNGPTNRDNISVDSRTINFYGSGNNSFFTNSNIYYDNRNLSDDTKVNSTYRNIFAIPNEYTRYEMFNDNTKQFNSNFEYDRDDYKSKNKIRYPGRKYRTPYAFNRIRSVFSRESTFSSELESNQSPVHSSISLPTITRRENKSHRKTLKAKRKHMKQKCTSNVVDKHKMPEITKKRQFTSKQKCKKQKCTSNVLDKEEISEITKKCQFTSNTSKTVYESCWKRFCIIL